MSSRIIALLVTGGVVAAGAACGQGRLLTRINTGGSNFNRANAQDGTSLATKGCKFVAAWAEQNETSDLTQDIYAAVSVDDGLTSIQASARTSSRASRRTATWPSSRIDHVHHSVATRPDLPLQVHARYSRLEILAAFGVGNRAKVAPWQSGVYWAKEASADLFAFTLDKTSGQFSPTTRYRDYAISRELVHWESQSTTRADSEPGRRFQQHVAKGTEVMLFARLRTTDRGFWFLGAATYVRHESEMPMAVTWRLEHPLPGDLFATFAAAVA